MVDKQLVIQIQPELLLDPNKGQLIEKFVLFLKGISPLNHCHVISGNENGAYINIELQSEDIQRLWEIIQTELSDKNNDFSIISKGVVVVCEGDKGWDDYLLLYHYDVSEKLDQFTPKKQ